MSYKQSSAYNISNIHALTFTTHHIIMLLKLFSLKASYIFSLSVCPFVLPHIHPSILDGCVSISDICLTGVVSEWFDSEQWCFFSLCGNREYYVRVRALLMFLECFVSRTERMFLALSFCSNHPHFFSSLWEWVLIALGKNYKTPTKPKTKCFNKSYWNSMLFELYLSSNKK